MPIIHIALDTSASASGVESLIHKLGLPIHTDNAESCDYLLSAATSGLSLVPAAGQGYGAITCDFVSGAHSHRRRFGGGNGQAIAKAIGVSGKFTPQVLDLTAGLGGDGFVLASLGCSVTLLERNPIVHCLLADGLRRACSAAQDDSELAAIMARLTLIETDSGDYLESLVQRKTSCDLAGDGRRDALQPDVVYIDPMFPERKKTAKVKKEMQAFHAIVGADIDAYNLLEKALSVAVYRVVVKRPSGAEFLNDKKPSYSLDGKSTRYDIYTLKKLPS